MRVAFHELFDTSGGQIRPKQKVQIGGVQMTPGVMFGGGVSFGGVDLSQYVGHDLEVEYAGDVAVIKGVY